MIIAIDGPSGAGKGTLARRLASFLDFAFLDTGLIYRALGKKCLEVDVNPTDTKAVLSLAQKLTSKDLEKPDLRTETVADVASKVSVIPEVRDVLLDFQRHFAAMPPDGKKGSILDGRDIGTIICPNAEIKLYITADLKTRAQRRYKELRENGIEVIYESVSRDLELRDTRDRARTIAPLKPAEDAYVLDTTGLTREEVFETAWSYITSKAPALLDKPRVLEDE